LIDEVRAQGPQTTALAERFGVTSPCAAMCSAWRKLVLLSRFHGGVRSFVARPPETSPTGSARRFSAGARICDAFARSAVPQRLLADLNIGTRSRPAHELLKHRGLRVITNNPPHRRLRWLKATPDCEAVIVAGGLVRGADQGIVGEVDGLHRQFKVDIVSIGISGIEANGTLRLTVM
jgi:DeoR family glycerol-3-phosphate regulon repressor